MRVDSTASELMSILANEDKKKPGADNSFAALFAQAVSAANAPQASAAPQAAEPAESAAAPTGAAAASSGTPPPAGTEKYKSWEEDFAEKAADPDYLPKTIKEASERMKAVEGRLKELLMDAMKENDVENVIDFAGDFVDGEYRITPYLWFEERSYKKLDPAMFQRPRYPWEEQVSLYVPEVKELTAEERKAKADFYKNLGNTPEINALAEEYALNSAICRSAYMSGDFHRQYERDPAGTMQDVRSQKWGEMKTSIWGNMRTNMIVCNTLPDD